MVEGPPNPNRSEHVPSREERIIVLARELSASQENFPFPGLEPEAYAKIKISEDEYPGYVAPIDERMERLVNEGMKVVPGAHPESGNVFILPAQSNDSENDSVSPAVLQTSEGMDPRLKELILLCRG